MKKIKSLLLLLLCFFTLTGFKQIDNATQKILESRNNIVQSLRNINVDESKIKSLTEKILNGELLDSMNETFESVEPSVVFTGIDGTYYERYEYPDGSIKMVQISPGIFTGTIITGDYQYGSVVGGFGQGTFYLRLYVPQGRQPYVTLSVLN